MVEGRIRDGAGLENRREQDRAGAIAAVALEGQRERTDCRRLWKWREIGAGLFVAAKEARRVDRERTVRIAHDVEAAFVESDDEQAVLLIGRGRHDLRHPLLQK